MENRLKEMNKLKNLTIRETVYNNEETLRSMLLNTQTFPVTSHARHYNIDQKNGREKFIRNSVSNSCTPCGRLRRSDRIEKSKRRIKSLEKDITLCERRLKGLQNALAIEMLYMKTKSAALEGYLTPPLINRSVQ